MRSLIAVLALALALPAHAIRIGEEDRMTLGQWAREQGLEYSDLPDIFGALLRVVCPWGVTGGVLVGKDLVLTVEHGVFTTDFDNEDGLVFCFIRSVFDTRPAAQKIRFDAINYRRGTTEEPDLRVADRDWLLLKLRNNPLDVEPWPLATAPGPGASVILLTQNQENFRQSPTIGECSVLFYERPSAATDCDSDQGASGSPLLVERASGFAVVGVTVATYGSEVDADCIDLTRCMTRHRLVDETIFEAVRELSR